MRHDAERSLMQGRLVEGMRQKARRGDLLHHPPMG
jgi:DNA invertase Pin-like site-specific DNA recombinase